MRRYIRKQIKLKAWIVLDEYPVWAIGFGDSEPDDGSWAYSATENAVAYSELKKELGV
jgi:hypothetical protein